MKDDRIKDALKNIAHRDVPESINLWPRIVARLDTQSSLMQFHRIRPLTIAVLFILILLMLTGVAYAISHMLGFVPGIGIIEQSTPLRGLASPVMEMRGGVTLTIEQAVLSGDKTTVIYRIEGIPAEAYAKNGNPSGCNKSPEIHLQDGTTMVFSDSGENRWGTGYEGKVIYPVIPTGINEATFILPCIYDTLPGVLPENWEVQMRFVPASLDLTVMPVVEISPSPKVNGSTVSPVYQPLIVEKVIETQDSYILIGKFHLNDLPDNRAILDSLSQLKITDATGRDVITSIPVDVNTVSNKKDEFAWAYEIKGKQQSWPLTITMDAVDIGLSGSGHGRFGFDTGPNPQANQEWTLDQEISSDGYSLKLVSVRRLQDGYEFNFKADPLITGVAIQIDGFNAVGGSGGGDGMGNFHQTRTYAGEIPSGKLNLTVSIQSVLLPGLWSITWQPGVLPAAPLDVTSSSPNSLCLTSDTLPRLTPPPADFNGNVLLYESMGGVNWTVDFGSLDGSQKQTISSQGNWATLSPDGRQVVYSGTDGMLHVTDIATGEHRMLGGAGGYNPRVSLDGQWVASVDHEDLSIINWDGSGLRHIPINAITFALAGWSADGTKVYITTPGAHGSILQTLDVSTGIVEDLFVLEDSSRKATYATISPDGNWIAYRDQENSGLYLVRTNGSDGHLIAKVPAAISSIVWSLDAKWLGLTLTNFNSDKRAVVILQPENCEIFMLSNLQGEIQGLMLPK